MKRAEGGGAGGCFECLGLEIPLPPSVCPPPPAPTPAAGDLALPGVGENAFTPLLQAQEDPLQVVLINPGALEPEIEYVNVCPARRQCIVWCWPGCRF